MSLAAGLCRQSTNYRLDGQVSITWTGSLSLSLFSVSGLSPSSSCLLFLTVPVVVLEGHVDLITFWGQVQFHCMNLYLFCEAFL